MAETFNLVALLSFDRNRQTEFEAYESQAFAIVARYGGRLERRLASLADDPSSPVELHIITFPDQFAFERYRADPELQSLAGLRAQVIRRTELWQVRDLPRF